ncbi:hypothetical protein OHA04_39330 [Streptomyces sp. NBC_01590]|uniref:hypothetical protein n=1 Tax=Streptomyces sp. NBC_01590 TaxID=2975887 RepID=UPI00386BC2F8
MVETIDIWWPAPLPGLSGRCAGYYPVAASTSTDMLGVPEGIRQMRMMKNAVVKINAMARCRSLVGALPRRVMNIIHDWPRIRVNVVAARSADQSRRLFELLPAAADRHEHDSQRQRLLDRRSTTVFPGLATGR